MSGPAGEDDYYHAIEEEFLRRRGAPLLLSPRDWALIGEWHAAGVPLRIVLQGIGNVFDLFESRAGAAPSRRINSLAYCRQEVLSLFDLYRTLHAAEAGRPVAGSDAAAPLARHLGRLSRRLGRALRDASAAGLDALVPLLADAVAGVKSLRADVRRATPDPAVLEGRLRALETAVLEGIRRSMPEPEMRAIETEAAERLVAERGRMTAAAWDATRAALVERLLRRRCGIPRLTLFD